MRPIIPLLMAILFAACGSGSNRVDDANAPKAAADPASGIDQVQFAGDLVRHARTHKSLQAYVLALQVLAANPARDLSVEKSETGGKDGGTKPDKAPITLQGVAAEARSLANGDAAVIAQIDGLVEEGARKKGAIDGPQRGESRVRAFGTDSYEVNFRGGRSAEVLVTGDGDTDLDMFIFDENGNLVCSDDDRTDQCYCRWNPRWSGAFTIKVKNLGDVYNQYVIVTN